MTVCAPVIRKNSDYSNGAAIFRHLSPPLFHLLAPFPISLLPCACPTGRLREDVMQMKLKFGAATFSLFILLSATTLIYAQTSPRTEAPPPASSFLSWLHKVTTRSSVRSSAHHPSTPLPLPRPATLATSAAPNESVEPAQTTPTHTLATQRKVTAPLQIPD